MAHGDWYDKLIIEGVHYDWTPSTVTFQDRGLRSTSNLAADLGRQIVTLERTTDASYPSREKRRTVRQYLALSWEGAFANLCLHDHLYALHTTQKPFFVQFDDELSRELQKVRPFDDADPRAFFAPTWPVRPFGWRPSAQVGWDKCVVVGSAYRDTGFSVDEETGLFVFDDPVPAGESVFVSYTWRMFCRVIEFALEPVQQTFGDDGRQMYKGTVVLEQLPLPTSDYVDPWPVVDGCTNAEDDTGGGIIGGGEIDVPCSCREYETAFPFTEPPSVSTPGDPLSTYEYEMPDGSLPIDHFLKRFAFGYGLAVSSTYDPQDQKQECGLDIYRTLTSDLLKSLGAQMLNANESYVAEIEFADLLPAEQQHQYPPDSIWDDVNGGVVSIEDLMLDPDDLRNYDWTIEFIGAKRAYARVDGPPPTYPIDCYTDHIGASTAFEPSSRYGPETVALPEGSGPCYRDPEPLSFPTTVSGDAFATCQEGTAGTADVEWIAVLRMAWNKFPYRPPARIRINVRHDVESTATRAQVFDSRGGLIARNAFNTPQEDTANGVKSDGNQDFTVELAPDGTGEVPLSAFGHSSDGFVPDGPASFEMEVDTRLLTVEMLAESPTFEASGPFMAVVHSPLCSIKSPAEAVGWFDGVDTFLDATPDDYVSNEDPFTVLPHDNPYYVPPIAGEYKLQFHDWAVLDGSEKAADNAGQKVTGFKVDIEVGVSEIGSLGVSRDFDLQLQHDPGGPPELGDVVTVSLAPGETQTASLWGPWGMDGLTEKDVSEIVGKMSLIVTGVRTAEDCAVHVSGLTLRPYFIPLCS